MIDYRFVQAALLLQMVLWVKLYDTKYTFEKFPKYLFYIAGGWIFTIVNVIKFNVGSFSTKVLLQYVLLILLAVRLFSIRYNFKQALCLGFLTVFFNSFFWEFFYHVYEFQIWLPYSLGFNWWYVRFPQWIRAFSGYWLTRRFPFKRTRLLRIGLGFSFILTAVQFVIRPHWLWLQPIHRVVCLIVLIAAIYINDTAYSKGETDEV